MADEPSTILDDLAALAESLRVAGDERHERVAAAVLERVRATPQAAPLDALKAAAKYGWEHPRWDLSAVLVGVEERFAATPQAAQVPEWLSYDPLRHLLTINGRRYAPEMFGPQGFLSPPGTLLRVEAGPGDVVTLSTVEQPAAPQPQAAQLPEGYALVPESYVSAVDDMVSWLAAWRRASLAVGRQATDASEAIDAMLAAAHAQGVG